MTANNIKSRKQYNERVENGDFTELGVIEKSENYTYYKVEYISPSLYKNTIIVAVFED